ncbi:MAG TPA: kelch repeat-containing protein [Blastocatellia bacterium]|nr:kelch repeat-containing protein [Blastocatellia bacterium]
MKTNTSWKRLVIVVGLGVTLFGVTAFPAVSEVIAVGALAHSELSGGPATVTVGKLNTVDSCDARIHASAELFHPGGSWTSTGELNIGRYSHTATLLANGKVLVAGGVGSDTCLTPASSAELYDPDSATWTPTGSLNTARYGHTATLLQNGLVLVAGGYASGYLNSAELYDPATGTWHPTGTFKTIRAVWNDYSTTSAAVLLPNDKVLVVGTSVSDVSAELYDQETGTWSSTSPPGVAGHMVLLPNGTVMAVSEGNIYEGSVAASTLYDPATERWSPAGDLNVIISPITMTLLRNGTLLVTGWRGYGLEQAEIYDTSTGKWSITGNLTFGTDFFGSQQSETEPSYNATILADGQVLVSSSHDADLYDATTGIWSLTRQLIVPRHSHTATLLANGETLIAGGLDNGLVSPPSVTSVQVFKQSRPIPTIVAGTKATKLLLAVYGVDFDSGAQILVNGEALEPLFGSSRSVDGRFTKSMVRRPGALSIQVRNSNGRVSNTVTVLVVAGQ